jgi:uncharacterized protein YdcH (DUF465 family)
MRKSRPSFTGIARPIDPEKQFDHLQRKHDELKAKVGELDSRPYLTSTEQVERARLKKEKLATKDALYHLRDDGF